MESGHRLITEFLLAELGRRPAPDRNESREAVSFAAAWALGMVLLGKGCSSGGSSGSGSGSINNHMVSDNTLGVTEPNGHDSEENGRAARANADSGVSGSGNGTSGGMGGLVDLCIEDRLQQHMEVTHPHPVNTPYQQPCQYTLSTYPVNTPYRHTLSNHISTSLSSLHGILTLTLIHTPYPYSHHRLSLIWFTHHLHHREEDVPLILICSRTPPPMAGRPVEEVTEGQDMM